MLPQEWNDLDLEGVAVTAAVASDGTLSPVGGLWSKLDGPTVDLARRGLIRTVVVAAAQDDVPPAYLAADAAPLRVVKAGSLGEAARLLHEETGPRQAVCRRERRLTELLDVFDRSLPIGTHYQALPLLREVQRDRLPRERGGPAREGDVPAEELSRWEEELRQERISYQRADLDEVLTDFTRLAPAARSNVPRFVVVGPPGSGKSTLVQHLAWRAAQGELRVGGRKLAPARVSLRGWERWAAAREEKSLPAYLTALYADAGPRPPRVEEWRRLLARGDTLLLLDGLDELEGDPAFAGVLTLALASWGDCPAVLTCRTISFEQHRGVCPGFPVFALAGLDDGQREAYVRAFLARHAARFDAEGLLERLRLSPQLGPLAANPLLLAIFCYLMDRPESKELPAARAAFYDEAVQRLLARGRSELPLIRRRRILERMALRLFVGGGQGRELTFNQATILKTLTAAAKAENLAAPSDVADAMLVELTRKPGLLRGDADHGYFFLHLTIHEFLAASALARLVNEKKTGWQTVVRADVKKRCVREFIDHTAWDPRWYEVVSLMAGLLRDPGALLEMLSDPEPTATNPHGDDLFRHRLGLAGRCLGEIAPSAAERASVVIDRITTSVILHPWQGPRTLTNDLTDPVSRVLPMVASVKGRVSGMPLADWLCKHINDDASPLRAWAMGIFTHLGPVAPRLPEVVAAAVRLLSEVVRPRTGDSPTRLLPFETVSAYAPELLPPLVQLALQGAVTSENWLRRIPEASVRKNVLPTLLSLVSSADPPTRARALALLGQLAGVVARYPEVVPALIRGLGAVESELRIASVKALSHLRGDALRYPDVLAGLGAALRDPHEDVTEAAVYALERIGAEAASDPEVIPGLVTYLRHRNVKARGAALSLLGQMGAALIDRAELIDELLATMDRGELMQLLTTSRWVADLQRLEDGLFVLERFGSVSRFRPTVASLLLPLCFERGRHEARHALAALERISPKDLHDEVVPRVVERLVPGDEQFPEWVMSAAEACRDALVARPEVIDSLTRRLLGGRTLPIRLQAAHVLCSLGAFASLPDQARAAISSCFANDARSERCIATAVALAWMGDPSDLFSLVGDPMSRSDALSELDTLVESGFRHPDLLPGLLSVGEASEEVVCLQAVYVLARLPEEVGNHRCATAFLARQLWRRGFYPVSGAFPPNPAEEVLFDIPEEALAHPDVLGDIMGCYLSDWASTLTQELGGYRPGEGLVRQLLNHSWRIFKSGEGWQAYRAMALAE